MPPLRWALLPSLAFLAFFTFLTYHYLPLSSSGAVTPGVTHIVMFKWKGSADEAAIADVSSPPRSSSHPLHPRFHLPSLPSHAPGRRPILKPPRQPPTSSPSSRNAPTPSTKRPTSSPSPAAATTPPRASRTASPTPSSSASAPCGSGTTTCATTRTTRSSRIQWVALWTRLSLWTLRQGGSIRPCVPGCFDLVLKILVMSMDPLLLSASYITIPSLFFLGAFKSSSL